MHALKNHGVVLNKAFLNVGSYKRRTERHEHLLLCTRFLSWHSCKVSFYMHHLREKKNIEHEIIYSHDLFLHNICSFSNNAALQPSNLIRSTCYDLRLLMFRRPISNLITQLECRYIFLKCYSLLSSVQQVRVCKSGVY